MKDVLKSFIMKLGELWNQNIIHILTLHKLSVDSWDLQEPYPFTRMPILDQEVDQCG